tara:strand:+ start:498 stop:1256 length:759 start_codon:yes stop_codon:yes gene_type:complete
MNMTETPAELNITRTRRVRRCGICRQEGHDRRCCPSPEAVEERRQRRALEEQRRQRYLEERARQQEAERQFDRENGFRSITVHNHNNYPVAVYYRMDRPSWERGNNIYKILRRPIIDSNGTYRIKMYHNTIIYIIPEAERISYIRRYGDSSWLDTNRYNGHVVGEYVMDTFENNILHASSLYAYEAPKPVLDQWKECALKSLYLLQQLERLGASNNDNLEPIMDLVQDITIPAHTYLDKELAGVPSVMTNVT